MNDRCQSWSFRCEFDPHISDLMRRIIHYRRAHYISYSCTDGVIKGFVYRIRGMNSSYVNGNLFASNWRRIPRKLSNDKQYKKLLSSGTLVEFGTRPYQTIETNKRKRHDDPRERAENAEIVTQLARCSYELHHKRQRRCNTYLSEDETYPGDLKAFIRNLYALLL
jgi:hypothetical protein